MQKKGLFFISDYRDVNCKPGRDPSYWILKALNEDERFNVYSTANRIVDSSCFGNIRFSELNYKGNIQIQKPGYNYGIYKAYRAVKDEVEIIHHNEMFQVGKGYNLIPILSNIKNKTFIVGPIELPHETFKDDFLAGSNGFKRLINKCVYISRPYLGVIFNILFKKTIENADVVIVPDNYVKRELSRYIDANKIEVINYGVDLSIYDEYRYCANENNYDIIYAGSAIERKGVKYLLEAIFLVKKEFPKVKLHLRATGYKVDEYKKLAGELNINENIIFHEKLEISEYLELLSNSRLLCLPTLSEGYGWTILDALCLGVPVVTTTECRCNALFEGGDIGLVVKPKDPHLLSEAISKLFDDYELCRKFSKNGLEKRKLFDFNTIIPKYIKLYEKYM